MQAFLDARAKELSKKNNERTCHYIFTDSDISVVNDLSQIFDEYSNFDVALTYRNNKDQPLNSGFIAVRGTLEAVQRYVVKSRNSFYGKGLYFSLMHKIWILVAKH